MYILYSNRDDADDSLSYASSFLHEREFHEAELIDDITTATEDDKMQRKIRIDRDYKSAIVLWQNFPFFFWYERWKFTNVIFFSIIEMKVENYSPTVVWYEFPNDGAHPTPETSPNFKY